jgi:HD-GYP domain-containing protein (c-di-GMP phosphodiesterase class II)
VGSSSFKKLASIVNRLSVFSNEISVRRRVDYRHLNQLSIELIGLLNTHSREVVSFVLDGSEQDDVSRFSIARSAVNTALLAALIGRDMGFNLMAESELIAGTFLHDVGMLRLPPDVINKKGVLSETETLLVQSHTVFGYQIVRQELSYPEGVALSALQHHERWDGLGYTQCLPGPAIPPVVRIGSVVDSFEAMVSDKPYRNSLTGYDAMKTIMSETSRRFDPQVIKTFVRIMGIYPVGQEVLLNDGTTARVVESHENTPLRPLVKVVRTKDGAKPAEEKYLDLLNQPSLYIARIVK